MNKESYDSFLEMLESADVDHLIKEPEAKDAPELLQALANNLHEFTKGTYKDGTPEYEILLTLASADDELLHFLSATNYTDINKVAISFFKLGAALGRHQGLRTFTKVVKKQAKVSASQSNAGRATVMKDHAATIMQEISKKFSSDDLTHSQIIVNIQNITGLGVAQSTYYKWVSNYKASGGKNIFNSKK